MPVICIKSKIKIEEFEENISIAFICKQDSNYHLKVNNDYFDSGDYRIKIENLIKKLDKKILDEYNEKNKGVLYLALVNYFLDYIPNIYSIKFESEDGDSIYYAEEYKKNGN